jgi:gluconokinase
MQSGYALDDADRASWLESLHDLLAQSKARGERVVLACSALKARYREQLGVPDDTSALIYLTASEALVRERLLQRAGHFMPAALIPSQFLDLEEPQHAIRVDASLPPAVVVTQIREALGLT